MSLAMVSKVQRYRRLRQQRQRPEPKQLSAKPTLEQYWQRRFPKYHLGRHIRLLLAELEAMPPDSGLIINMPPRHSKTESVLAYLEYYLGNNPAHELVFASYSADMANQKSRKIRNEVEAGLCFPACFPDVTVAADAAAVKEWRTTHGGGLVAVGMGGSLTGKGAHLAVIDDPLKGRREAESARYREAVIEWYQSVLYTRMEPGGRIILIQTRWHDGDLSGWLKKQLEDGELGDRTWRVLSLPALAEDDEDPLGRLPGEALWPERFAATKLHGIRDSVGPYEWAALYQQRPTLKGGSVFGEGVVRCDPAVSLEGGRIFVTADLAASVKTSADYSVFLAGVVWGRGAEMTGKLLEVRRGQWDIRRQIAEMKALQELYGVVVHVERASNSLPVIQQARSEGLRITEVAPDGDKFSRAQPVAAAWNSGRLEVPTAPWASVLLAEATGFKGDGSDEHDDQVDALAYFWRVAERGGSNFRAKNG